jgi:DNA-binding PadR family transcriptional regulator
MIYPALTYLEEIGYAAVEMEGTRKRYHLTEEGRANYEQNRETATRILSEMERIGAEMAQARQAVESGLVPEETGAVTEELEAARYEIRRAQHKHGPYTPEESRRIAAILRGAAAEIQRVLAKGE